MKYLYLNSIVLKLLWFRNMVLDYKKNVLVCNVTETTDQTMLKFLIDVQTNAGQVLDGNLPTLILHE